MKQSFTSHPNVLQASACRYPPFFNNGGGRMWEVHPEGQPNESRRMTVNEVDDNFLATMEIELLAGENFTPGRERSDGNFTSEFLLSQSAAEMFGRKEIIGRQMEWVGHGTGTVVGVFKDYHFDSLRKKVGPLVLIKQTRLYSYLILTVRSDEFDETMAFLETQWKAYVPNEPFHYVFWTTFSNLHTAMIFA